MSATQQVSPFVVPAPAPAVEPPSQAAQVVRMPKARPRQVRTRGSYMTAEQLERFLKAAKEYGPREHAMFLFAVAHGARPSEVCNLRIADVNFHNDQVHIARLKGPAYDADPVEGEGERLVR